MIRFELLIPIFIFTRLITKFPSKQFMIELTNVVVLQKQMLLWFILRQWWLIRSLNLNQPKEKSQTQPNQIKIIKNKNKN